MEGINDDEEQKLRQGPQVSMYWGCHLCQLAQVPA